MERIKAPKVPISASPSTITEAEVLLLPRLQPVSHGDQRS